MFTMPKKIPPKVKKGTPSVSKDGTITGVWGWGVDKKLDTFVAQPAEYIEVKNVLVNGESVEFDKPAVTLLYPVPPSSEHGTLKEKDDHCEKAIHWSKNPNPPIGSEDHLAKFSKDLFHSFKGVPATLVIPFKVKLDELNIELEAGTVLDVNADTPVMVLTALSQVLDIWLEDMANGALKPAAQSLIISKPDGSVFLPPLKEIGHKIHIVGADWAKGPDKTSINYSVQSAVADQIAAKMDEQIMAAFPTTAATATEVAAAQNQTVLSMKKLKEAMKDFVSPAKKINEFHKWPDPDETANNYYYTVKEGKKVVIGGSVYDAHQKIAWTDAAQLLSKYGVSWFYEHIMKTEKPPMFKVETTYGIDPHVSVDPATLLVNKNEQNDWTSPLQKVDLKYPGSLSMTSMIDQFHAEMLHKGYHVTNYFVDKDLKSYQWTVSATLEKIPEDAFGWSETGQLTLAQRDMCIQSLKRMDQVSEGSEGDLGYIPQLELPNWLWVFERRGLRTDFWKRIELHWSYPLLRIVGIYNASLKWGHKTHVQEMEVEDYTTDEARDVIVYLLNDVAIEKIRKVHNIDKEKGIGHGG